MNLLKLLIGGAALGTILVAFRDFENRRWLLPGQAVRPATESELETEEPVLGYDGMDRDTLTDWLGSADLDRDTLRRVQRYERANLARGPVLGTIEDLLG